MTITTDLGVRAAAVAVVIIVAGLALAVEPMQVDGFETGDLSGWSSFVP